MSVTAINALAIIDVGAIDTDGRNVRDDLGDLTELACSIRAVGVLQPLTVARAGDGRFTLVHGHRRLGAALLAGRTTVPCIVRAPRSEVEVRIERLAENLHRRSLTALEEAKQYRLLQEAGMTQSDIARRVGVSSSTVSTRLALLELPDEAQDLVRTGRLTVGEAVSLARQVRKTGKGTVGGNLPAYRDHFSWRHRLAYDVGAWCTHPEREQVGKVACGPCWEAAIRADERRLNEAPPARLGSVVDDAAVERAVAGDAPRRLTVAEREAAVRRLHRAGLSDYEIADRLRTTDRTVFRVRQRLGLPTNFPQDRGATG